MVVNNPTCTGCPYPVCPVHPGLFHLPETNCPGSYGVLSCAVYGPGPVSGCLSYAPDAGSLIKINFQNKAHKCLNLYKDTINLLSMRHKMIKETVYTKKSRLCSM